MSKFNEIRDLVLGLEADFEKFYDKNNQAAGTRVRKGMQELKTLAQKIRTEVQDIKNAEAAKATATTTSSKDKGKDKDKDKAKAKTPAKKK